MIDTLNLKFKALNKKKNSEKVKEELKLEIYSIILGYYSSIKDRKLQPINDDVINDLIVKIQILLNTTNPLMSKENSLDSIKICIKDLLDDDNIDVRKSTKFFNAFIQGYYYYINLVKQNSIQKKYSNIENKLSKIKNRIN